MYPNWLNPNIDRKIFLEKFLKIGFSQNGEDEFIRGFFWEDILNGKTSQYLDIGCYDEVLYSNTKLLSLIGWTGIAVDANPDTAHRWKAGRPTDHFYNLAVGSESQCQRNKTVEFFRFADGALNTLEKDVAKEWVNKGCELKDIIGVKCTKIDIIGETIKKDHPNFKPRLLNIDIEQVNYLSSFPDFLKILSYPELICMEWVSQGFGLDNFKSSEEYAILKDSGYQIEALIGGNLLASYDGGISVKS